MANSGSTELAPTSVELSSSSEPDIAPEIAGLSPAQLAMRRLRRDKLTMTALVVAALFVVMAIVAPILSALHVLKPEEFHSNLIDPATGSLPIGPFGGVSWAHPFGVEPTTGRDILSRLVLGVTFSLIVSISATIIAVVLGTVIGLIAGFRGGAVDFWVGRLIDMTLSFPQTLMLLALSGVFIQRLTETFHVPAGNVANGVYIILVMGLFGWPSFARLIRGQVLSQREREYVEAARSLGATNRRIYFKELLPNLWAPILVYTTLILPTYVSAEAALSFLGVGIKPPTPTLGNILTESVVYASGDFVFFFLPALFIAVIVISFNLLGDGLRDALDPKGDR